jgi:hypothetical protein
MHSISVLKLNVGTSVDKFVSYLQTFDKVMVTLLKRDHRNSAGVWSYFSR